MISLGMPNPESLTSSKGICTCGSTAATPGIGADLVRDRRNVDRHDADADAAARAVADDDLADVVVAAAAHETR